ncbi:hypothetical protein PG991_009374 [Apiospora marii]|uniref:Uncharacterized protein n=1 Tax=Apiospora marii TaxID=335849 RepID=A0ABR1RKJ7_9PEZI
MDRNFVAAFQLTLGTMNHAASAVGWLPTVGREQDSARVIQRNRDAVKAAVTTVRRPWLAQLGSARPSISSLQAFFQLSQILAEASSIGHIKGFVMARGIHGYPEDGTVASISQKGPALPLLLAFSPVALLSLWAWRMSFTGAPTAKASYAIASEVLPPGSTASSLPAAKALEALAPSPLKGEYLASQPWMKAAARASIAHRSQHYMDGHLSQPTEVLPNTTDRAQTALEMRRARPDSLSRARSTLPRTAGQTLVATLSRGYGSSEHEMQDQEDKRVAYVQQPQRRGVPGLGD